MQTEASTAASDATRNSAFPAQRTSANSPAAVPSKPTSGLIKDTVVVPLYGRAAVEFTANQPGLTLFHCHIQTHMDYGFKALFRYG